MFTAKTTGTPFANQPKDTYFNNNVLLLHGDNIIGANNSVFLNNITANTYTPFNGTYSVYLNGSTSYLTVPSIINYDFSSSNFTIEAWIYPTSLAAQSIIINKVASGSVVGAFDIRLQTDGTIIVYYSNASGGSWSDNFTTTLTAPLNTWTHVALVRNGSVFTTYINGISSGSSNNPTFVATVYESAVTLNVGANGDGSSKFTGYISNVRINNGTAIYTGNFTPPSSPLTTTTQTGSGNVVPILTGTTLLTCQSPVIIDNALNASITTSGSPAISAGATAITKTGNPSQGSYSPFSTTGWSNYFNGTTDYLTYNQATALGTSDFTIEMWAYSTSFSAQQWLWGQRNNADTSLYIFIDTSGQIGVGGDISTYITSSSLSLNTWNHIALVRTGGNSLKLYINGIQSGSTSTTTQSFTYTGTQCIAHNTSGTGYYFTGYISNVRVIQGTGLYTSNFTQPLAALTAITNTSILTCQSNQFVGSNTTSSNVAITNSGNTSVLPFSPLAPTNAYSKNKVGGSIYFNGSTDRLTLPNSTTGLQFGSSDFTIEFFMYNTSSTSTARIINNWQSTTATAASWEVLATSTGVNFNCSSNGTAVAMACSGPGTISLNTWNHVAAVRNGNIFSLYVNGTLAVSNTQTITLQTADTITVGARNNLGTYAEYFNGYLSNIRVIKGNALYTSNFTVSNTYPSSTANTVLLLNANTFAGTLGSSVVNNNVGTYSIVPTNFSNPNQQTPYVKPYKTAYSNNALIFYKPGSLSAT